MKVDFSANIKDMNPIETEYQGYWFRSRLEARWAVFFEEMQSDWGYEVQGFRLRESKSEDQILYLPDFYIEDVETPWEDSTAIWVEVKGAMKKKDIDKCTSLAIESNHPVLMVQGDPMDEEITLYRKHTPTQKVKFAATARGIKIIKARVSPATERLKDAQQQARQERF